MYLHIECMLLDGLVFIMSTRNLASRASKHTRLVAMYIAVAIRPRVYLTYTVTSEVLVSFLPEVLAQI